MDILFKFPFGTEELEGIAARGDFDLTQHQKHSGKPQEVFDEEVKHAVAKLDDDEAARPAARRREAGENRRAKGAPRMKRADWCDRLFKGFYVPHVIEPSAGLDRLALAVAATRVHEVEKTDDKGKKETLTVMHLHPRVAPIKVGESSRC